MVAALKESMALAAGSQVRGRRSDGRPLISLAAHRFTGRNSSTSNGARTADVVWRLCSALGLTFEEL